MRTNCQEARDAIAHCVEESLSDKLLLLQRLRRTLTQLKNIDHKLPFKVGNDLERHQKGSFVCIPALAATSTIQSRSVPAHSPWSAATKSAFLRRAQGKLRAAVGSHLYPR